MTSEQLDTRRICDAFDRDLASYRAPAGLAERARAGGLRRARRRRAHQAASVAAAAAAVLAGLVIVPQAGLLRPGTAPGRAALPSAASVSTAMLTAFQAAGGDVVYVREVAVHRGTVVDRSQEWAWPARPAAGQQVHERDVYAVRTPASATALTLAQDDGLVYRAPPEPRFVNPGRLTQVCYRGTGPCDRNGIENRAGTWSRARLRDVGLVGTPVGRGDMFSPAGIAAEIRTGGWRIVRRTRLDGQPALELRAASDVMFLPVPTGPRGQRVLAPAGGRLWVSVRTHLPLRWAAGSGASWAAQADYAYLPPTPASLALLRVPIPPGYPRSEFFHQP